MVKTLILIQPVLVFLLYKLNDWSWGASLIAAIIFGLLTCPLAWYVYVR
jgi:hypothetical protein